MSLTITNVLDNGTFQEKVHNAIKNPVFEYDGTLYVYIIIIIIVGTTNNIFTHRFDILTASYYHVSINKSKG